MSELRKAVEEYLAIRRCCGFQLKKASRFLRQFADFAEGRGASFITAELAVSWAGQPGAARSRVCAERLSCLRAFARHRQASDPRCEVPASDVFPYRIRRKPPFIYREEEIRQLLCSARRLAGRLGLRPQTFATLYGLLAAAGMRTSEAVSLDRRDVDPERHLIRIRRSKFGKSRLIPVHATTSLALQRYSTLRDRVFPRPEGSSFFLSELGRRPAVGSVQGTFRRLCRQAGLHRPEQDRPPRLHDLRHTFAVRTLLSWYRAGLDVHSRMLLLSTYLGHGDVEATYWYLSAVPELLGLAAQRLHRPEQGGLP